MGIFTQSILNSTTKARPSAVSASKRSYVRSRLRELGLSNVELRRSEATYLPGLLRDDERIGGAIAGKGKDGHYMIVATNRRVIILDCKPLFKDVENIGYHVVAGVSHGDGLLYTVTLHTRLGEFKMKTPYGKAARAFEDYIERRCLEQNNVHEYDKE